MTAQGGPPEATLTRIGVTNAIRYLSAATSFAAMAEGCHDATGHFGANNIPNVIRYVDQAAHQLGLMLINPGIRDIRVMDLEAGLAAAHAREAALMAALQSILEHCGNEGVARSTVAERVIERVEDTALSALAVKP